MKVKKNINREANTESLEKITRFLDKYFELSELSMDPSMGRFIPMVYSKSEAEMADVFEADYLKNFNGLMIKGDKLVSTIFTSAFPHDEILKSFLEKSSSGDLLFLHHPIPLECGDPKGELGKGFKKNNLKLIKKIKQKKLSIYVCHAPLDYHKKVSTGRSIAEALGGKIVSTFLPYGGGDVGLIVKIKQLSTNQLIGRLEDIFNIPYVEFAGKKLKKIIRVGIVPGGGDDIEYSEMSKKLGAQAYITGEIFSNQRGKWATENRKKLKEYANGVDISLIAVSHSASEFLVMKTQIVKLFEEKLNLKVVSLPQENWWV